MSDKVGAGAIRGATRHHKAGLVCDCHDEVWTVLSIREDDTDGIVLSALERDAVGVGPVTGRPRGSEPGGTGAEVVYFGSWSNPEGYNVFDAGINGECVLAVCRCEEVAFVVDGLVIVSLIIEGVVNL